MVDTSNAPVNLEKEIETLCRRHIKSATLTDHAYSYIAQLIKEDAPRNSAELFALIRDFMTDGIVYSDAEASKICDVLQKVFLDKKLIVLEQRDTIVAEKLTNSV